MMKIPNRVQLNMDTVTVLLQVVHARKKTRMLLALLSRPNSSGFSLVRPVKYHDENPEQSSAHTDTMLLLSTRENKPECCWHCYRDRIQVDFTLVRPFLDDLPFLDADLSSTFHRRASHAFFPHSWRLEMKLRLFAPCCASLARVRQYKNNPKS
jgi:hypothetical protein